MEDGSRIAEASAGSCAAPVVTRSDSSIVSDAGVRRSAGVVTKLESPETSELYPGICRRFWFAISAAWLILIADPFFRAVKEDDLKENFCRGAAFDRASCSLVERALSASEYVRWSYAGMYEEASLTSFERRAMPAKQ